MTYESLKCFTLFPFCTMDRKFGFGIVDTEEGSASCHKSHCLCCFFQAHLLDYHFGYKPSDLSLLVKKLNKLLTLYPYNDRFKAVRFKYSHK